MKFSVTMFWSFMHTHTACTAPAATVEVVCDRDAAFLRSHNEPWLCVKNAEYVFAGHEALLHVADL